MKDSDLVGNGKYTFAVEVINDAGKIVLDTVNVTNTKTITLDKFINSSSTGSAATSVTATLIDKAVLTFFETPKKGHIPRNFESTILLVKIPANKIEVIAVTLFIYGYLLVFTICSIANRP